MPKIAAADGTKLYVEEVGAGTPVVFVHEYAADYRTWEPQMRHFARSHRCVTYSQRGYPPSDVPEDPDKYTQDLFRDDVIASWMRSRSTGRISSAIPWARRRRSTSASATQRCVSVTAAGCGYGSSADPKVVEESRAASRETAKMFAESTMADAAAKYGDGSHPSGAQEQGSARLRGVRQDAERAFAARAFADHGQSASQASDLVGYAGRSEEILRRRC